MGKIILEITMRDKETSSEESEEESSEEVSDDVSRESAQEEESKMIGDFGRETQA